jgi:hypothetical protein
MTAPCIMSTSSSANRRVILPATDEVTGSELPSSLGRRETCARRCARAFAEAYVEAVPRDMRLWRGFILVGAQHAVPVAFRRTLPRRVILPATDEVTGSETGLWSTRHVRSGAEFASG